MKYGGRITAWDMYFYLKNIANRLSGFVHWAVENGRARVVYRFWDSQNLSAGLVAQVAHLRGLSKGVSGCSTAPDRNRGADGTFSIALYEVCVAAMIFSGSGNVPPAPNSHSYFCIISCRE
jgi:hypothetical protein